MRSSADVINKINYLEEKFPVHEWRYNDIDLWPVYRIGSYTSVTESLLFHAPERSSLERVATRMKRAWDASTRIALARIKDRAKNARPSRKADILFFSDGVSITQFDGAWYDRIVDPLACELDNLGIPYLKLTPLTLAHTPRRTPSHFIQPDLDRIKLLAPYRAKAAKQQPVVRLPQWEEFFSEASDIFEGKAHSLTWLMTRAQRLDAMSRYFGKYITQAGMRRAFAVTWYSLEGMAVVLAARRAGIPAADLQHGMQNDHVAYARWNNVPSTGYNVMPDEFWVWGEEEADTIRRWQEGATASHRPVVMGNAWLDAWRMADDPVIRQTLNETMKLREREGGPQIMVSLSWGLAPEETDLIMQAARLANPEITWWWRLHPVEAHKKHKLRQQISKWGIQKSIIEEATDLPLFAVLKVVDATIAHSSTTIREAAIFGKPSIITSDYGADAHAELIKQGIAMHAGSPEDIVNCIETMLYRPQEINYNNNPAPMPLKKLLRTINSSM